MANVARSGEEEGEDRVVNGYVRRHEIVLVNLQPHSQRITSWIFRTMHANTSVLPSCQDRADQEDPRSTQRHLADHPRPESTVLRKSCRNGYVGI